MRSLETNLYWKYRLFWTLGALCTTGSVLPLILGMLPPDRIPNCLLWIGWGVAIVVPFMGYWFSIRGAVCRQQYISREVLQWKCRLFSKVAAADPVLVKKIIDRHIKDHAKNDEESGLMPSSNYAGILAARISNHVRSQVEYRLERSGRKYLWLALVGFPFLIWAWLCMCDCFAGGSNGENLASFSWSQSLLNSKWIALGKIRSIVLAVTVLIVLVSVAIAEVIIHYIAKTRKDGDEITLKVENEHATVSALLAGIHELRMGNAVGRFWHYAGAAYRTAEGIWKALAKAYRFTVNAKALIYGVAWLSFGLVLILLAKFGKSSPKELTTVAGGMSLIVGYYAFIAIPFFEMLIKGRRLNFASGLIRELDELEPVSGAVRELGDKEPVLVVKRVLEAPGPAALAHAELLCVDNLKIRRGEHVGIVGVTGSGKSTLLKALIGEMEIESHTVALMGNDPRRIPPAKLAEWVGYVPQNPYVFNATVRENLLMGQGDDIPDDRLWEIIQSLRMETLVERSTLRPRGGDGLDSVLSANGVDISGGEAVKIALARILLRETPPIILLDEPMDFLDQNTRNIVRAIIDEKFRDRTLLLVSHRPSVLSGMDRILVMDGGRIVDEGNYRQLLRRPGLFARLHALETGQATNAAMATLPNLMKGDWETRVRNALGYVKVFSDVSWQVLAELARSSHEIKFKKGERIVARGDYGDSMFVIVDGEVEINGRLFKRGDCFGEIAVFTEDSRRTADVVCAVDCVLAELKRKDVLRVCEHDAMTAIRILEAVATIVSREVSSREVGH